VRGTTSKRIGRKKGEGGAREENGRNDTKKNKDARIYGKENETRKEINEEKHKVEEISEMIGAEALKVVSEEGVVDAIGSQYEGKYGGICMAYFNGDYPTDRNDYEKEL
ncbi:amidophosphoribosyltransferase, partial [Bacillus sp. MB353a]